MWLIDLGPPVVVKPSPRVLLREDSLGLASMGHKQQGRAGQTAHSEEGRKGLAVLGLLSTIWMKQRSLAVMLLGALGKTTLPRGKQAQGHPPLRTKMPSGFLFAACGQY